MGDNTIIIHIGGNDIHSIVLPDIMKKDRCCLKQEKPGTCMTVCGIGSALCDKIITPYNCGCKNEAMANAMTGVLKTLVEANIAKKILFSTMPVPPQFIKMGREAIKSY